MSFKNIILLISFSIPFVFYSCEKDEPYSGRIVEQKDLEKRSSILYVRNENKPFTGMVIETSKNGEIGAEIMVKEGKPHGLMRIRYLNGQIEREIMYNNGIMDGFAKILV